MQSEKSQVSAELMVYMGIMILLFSMAALSAGQRQQEIYSEQVYTDAKNTLNKIAAEIDIAAEVGSGYSNSFYMPDKLVGGINYSIGVDSQHQIIYIEWLDKNYTIPIPTSSISGAVPKGDSRIYNNGGLIVIERPNPV